MNWRDFVFHPEKRNFEPIGNSVHTAEVLDSGKALLIFLLLYPQILFIDSNR